MKIKKIALEGLWLFGIIGSIFSITILSIKNNVFHINNLLGIHTTIVIPYGGKLLSEEETINLIDKTKKEKNEAIEVSKKLQEENEKLNDIIVEKERQVKYFNASFIVNGIKKYINIVHPIAIIENKQYISIPTVENLLNKKININTENGTIYINNITNMNSNDSSRLQPSMKLPMMDVCEPYSYKHGYSIKPPAWIKIAGKPYYDGFVLNSSRGGEAFINLDRKYSILAFCFGFVNETNTDKPNSYDIARAERSRTRVIVSADNKILKDEIIPLDKLMCSEPLALNYAQYLTIKVTGQKSKTGSGEFGFVNITLVE